MPKLTLLAALGPWGEMGSKGLTPWDPIPALQEHFRVHTRNKTLIMGYRTWGGLNGPSLSGKNIVITRHHARNVFDATTFSFLSEALGSLEDNEDSVIIGGARLFEDAIPLVDTAVITYVPGNLIKRASDVKFPLRCLQEHLEEDVTFSFNLGQGISVKKFVPKNQDKTKKRVSE